MNMHTNGVRVPAWAITAIAVGAVVWGAGYAFGQKSKDNDAAFEIISTRLCRIERAVNIEPWATCPQGKR